MLVCLAGSSGLDTQGVLGIGMLAVSKELDILVRDDAGLIRRVSGAYLDSEVHKTMAFIPKCSVYGLFNLV